MSESPLHPIGRRRRSVRIAALAAVSLLCAVPIQAQQDTTHRGMPGMPGMKMPAKPKATATPKSTTKATAKTPTRRTKQAVPKKTAGKAPAAGTPSPRRATAAPSRGSMRDMAMPGMAHDSAMAHHPTDNAHAKPGTMPGMDMTHPMADSAHAMHGMPGMAHDSAMKGMPMSGHPGMGAHDSTMKGMPGMAMPHDTGSMRGMGMSGEMGSMHMMTPDPLGVSMDRMGSGTTWVPDAAPIPSLYFSAPGHWDVTGHGFAFLQYDKQGGDRGSSQFGSLNWLMLMASHTLAGGRFQVRTMLSLDALTVTPRGYPLLLQSGEAYDGAPLHDRQHPHDLFMELSALYEKPVTKSVGVMLYAAPSGEPALGPVAFMHRPSAMDIPTAPITHHWSDATHISFGVLSAGVFTHTLKLEGSVFNGREPDQYRFNFDPIKFDSYSGRATFNPTSEWSLSAGYGYLKSPEALKPDESTHRVTASALYGTTLGKDGQWASTVIYGANKSSTHPDLSHSLLVESEAVIDTHNTVFGRAEVVQKSAEDLSLDTAPFNFATDRSFNVGELSLGYIRDFARFSRGTLGLGAMGTVNVVPSVLEPAYGSRTPLGLFVFLRARPFRNGMSMANPSGDMPGMSHD